MAQVPNDDDEVKIDDRNNREYDIVIYGATGFTGSVVINQLIKRYLTSNLNIKFAIAGRNETKLKKLRNDLQNEFSNKTKNNQQSNYIKNLPYIIADVGNKESLKAMIITTKLVISCIGPYRLIGENVVEICALSGTHYVDICGEPDFMERCAFKYYDIAKKNKSIIVSACGFDSIPSDMGCSFIDQFYVRNKSICSSINGYLTGTAPNGYSAHHTTLKAAVHGISNADKLRSLRKEIEKKSYRISKKQINRCGKKQKINRSIYYFSNDVKKYSMLFPFADSAVVNNSQGISSSLLYSQGVKTKTFPQYAAYISFNSYWQCIQAVGIGGLGSTLCNFEWGKKLLMDYPYLCTFGAFTEEGPTKKQRESQTFSFKFFAKGYSKNLCEKYDYNMDELKKLNCDFNIKASVSGKDIGYSGTAKILIESAIVLLQEQRKINEGDLNKGFPAITGGIFTPSTVFANTSLIQRLNEVGITFLINFDDDNDDDDSDDDYDEHKQLINDDNENEQNISDDFEVIKMPNKANDDENTQNIVNDNDDGDNDSDNAPDQVDEYDYNKFSNIVDDDVPR